MATDSLRIFNKNLAEKLFDEGKEEDEIFEICFFEDEIPLDYYGSFAYLGYEWENTISSLEFFPNDEDGETFILILPSHASKIIVSLRKHIQNLTIMSEKEIDKISQFINYCTQNDGLMIAYTFDF